MGFSSLFLASRVAALAAGLGYLQPDGGGGGLAADAARHAGRQLIEQTNGNGLSTGVIVVYALVSVVLVLVSGLMAGLVLGLLSLDRVDLEVAKRTGSDKQKWLVSRVEPLTKNPHFVLCALVLVNAICNTALPLFIDRLLNPLAAILISVTAILIVGEIAPQALCKRYGLEIGAYCSWLVRALMILTAPIAWPLGKVLDWLLGEESALFRRQELKALVGLHAETQQDGSVGALTTDEVQVIQGALDMASKTADSVMTPKSKVFMLSGDAVIDKPLLRAVILKGHSRVPVYKGDNKQAILGLILVKELVLVDEMAGVKVKDLRLQEMPFLRADIPLYDVMKIFRFGRKHMACLTRVANDPSASGKLRDGGGTGGSGGILRTGSGLPFFRRTSPALATAAGQPVEEVVGIITIEDVLEELLQAEIVDETDQFEDNLQTVHAPPQVSLKELPPNLRRFLSPRRSMHGFDAAAEVARLSAAEVSRLSTASSTGTTTTSATGTSGGGTNQLQQQPQQGLGPGQQQAAAVGAAVAAGVGAGRAPSPLGVPPARQASLGAAAAASALMMAGTADGTKADTMAAALAAGVRAAELNHGGGGGGAAAANGGPGIAAATAAGMGAHGSGGGGQQQQRVVPEPGSRPPLPPSHHPSGSSSAHPGGAAADVANGGGVHVVLELGQLHGRTSTGGGSGDREDEERQQRRPLVLHDGRASGDF